MKIKNKLLKNTITFLLLGLVVACSQNRYHINETNYYDLIGECIPLEDTLLLKADKKPVNGVVFDEHEGGQLLHESYYKNGMKNGLSRRWDVNGNLWYECNFKDGLRTGIEREWQNGQVMNELNFINGAKHGLCRGWYRNNQLSDEGYYKDNWEYGLWKYWYENGQLKAEENYEEGSLISKTCWDEDGNEIECD
jgi:antitoxin component YwqK of YwqJK toxin-antitoxin module